MKIKRIILISLGALLLLGMGYIGWLNFTNPHNYKTVGDIPAPMGFTKVDAPRGSFAEYTRSLPLKPRGEKVKYFTGGDARLQLLAASVIDMPLLSNDEQCADAAMHLRAEHLWRNGRYGQIRFRDVNGNTLSYGGGSSRPAFEKFMRRVYSTCSTYSMHRFDTKPIDLADVKPGDVLVFPAANGRMGHAQLIADVATDRRGRKALLIVEGNTPARDIHVLRNPFFFSNPWYIIDPAKPGSTMIEKGYAMKNGGIRAYK